MCTPSWCYSASVLNPATSLRTILHCALLLVQAVVQRLEAESAAQREAQREEFRKREEAMVAKHAAALKVGGPRGGGTTDALEAPLFG